MSTVFLYAGQGSQRVGMGKDFYNTYVEYRNFIDGLQTDFDIKRLMHEGTEEELKDTKYTQPCMAAFAAGVTQILLNHGIVPDAACGLSLGEYGALYAANVFSANTYVELVEYRGKAMAEAAKGLDCSMSAILGIKESKIIEEAVEKYNGSGYVTVANYNCPGQTVICGDEEAVVNLESILKEQGAKRCVRLKVSGPFHTKYMQPAGEELKNYFQTVQWNKASIPVASNVTGTFIGKEESIPELLIKQIQSSVRLEDDLKTLLEAGYTNFIEIGPGNTMSGFLKKTAKVVNAEVTIYGIDTVEDLQKLEKGI